MDLNQILLPRKQNNADAELLRAVLEVEPCKKTRVV